MVLVLGCDDGDITLQSFDFSNQSIQKCSDNYLMYKIKDNELLLIQLTETLYDEAFVNEETGDTPRVINITSSTPIIYRMYSGTVASTTVCSELAPATPTVTNEWEATAGTIQVESNALTDSDDNITGYTHNITLLNVTFSGTDDSFSFESYIFGDWETGI